jgi:hypothetical protein
MSDLWLVRISSLSSAVGLYVVLLEVLLFNLYWIPKLHKTTYKESYIAGSSTCSTKESSIHLTKSMSAAKEGQQKYCETVYSGSGINHMWILKNSKDLLDNLQSRSFSQVSFIKTFDFLTLYTTLPHDKLKTRLKDTNPQTLYQRECLKRSWMICG